MCTYEKICVCSDKWGFSALHLRTSLITSREEGRGSQSMVFPPSLFGNIYIFIVWVFFAFQDLVRSTSHTLWAKAFFAFSQIAMNVRFLYFLPNLHFLVHFCNIRSTFVLLRSWKSTVWDVSLQRTCTIACQMRHMYCVIMIKASLASTFLNPLVQ